MKQIIIAAAIAAIATSAFAGNGEQFMRAAIAPIPTEDGCLQAGQKGALVLGGAGFTRSADGKLYTTQSTWWAARKAALALASITGHPNIKVFRAPDDDTVRFIGVAQGKECNL